IYKFVYNNKNMDSFTIACTGNTSILESKFFPPIQLNGKYQLGLKNLYSYNTIFNVKEPNNVLSYYKVNAYNMKKGSMTIEDFKTELGKHGLILKSDTEITSTNPNIRLVNKGLLPLRRSNSLRTDFDVQDDIFFYDIMGKHDIVIPPGVYEINEIEAEIKNVIPEVVLIGDNKSMKCELYAPVVFDFDTEGFGKSLLGFRGLSMPDVKTISETRVNINNINVIRVHCNIVSSSYINGKENHSVYDFYPTVPPRFKMVEVPSNIIYYPIDVGSIDTFTVSLRDQNDELVDFNGEEVRICVNNQDILTLPSQSYLYVKGKFSNKDKGHFVKNGLAFLFDEVRYEIASKEVDSVRNPGIASLMKYVCSPNTKKRYSNACIDTDDNLKKISENGEFSGCIPMEMLLGVFEDFDRVLVNVKQELILKIARNSLNAIFTTAEVANPDPIPKVTIDEIQWFIPHILASDSEKLTIQNAVANSKSFNISFRSYELHMMPSYPTSRTKHTWSVKTTNQLEKPRYVMFGFQTERDNAARKRCDEFDHCNLKNIKVFLNSEYYPYSDLNLNFEKKDIAKAYEMFVRFQSRYIMVVLNTIFTIFP